MLAKKTPPNLGEFVERSVNFSLHSWQKDYLCPLLERCIHERGLRIAIHAPPRYGKSIIVSQRLPAWILACDPAHRVGLAMHNETKAARFGTVIKSLMLDPWYQKEYPLAKVRKDAASGGFFTEAGERRADGNPSFSALGMLSGMVGFGADTWIIDDPYKSREDAFSETINEKVWSWYEDLRTRVDGSANVIVMFHRWHDNDMAGRMIASGEFEYYRFPAIADGKPDDPTNRAPGELLSPMRSHEWLENIREKDPKTFLGLFQGEPRPDEGNLLKREDFRVCQQAPRLRMWVRYWDMAVSIKASGDYTVGALFGVGQDGQMYVRDIKRFRAEWPDARQIMIETALADAKLAQDEGWNYQIGMDARATQMGFVQDMARNELLSRIPIWPDKAKGDKKERASGWIARARLGKLNLIPGWDHQAFINEGLAFDGHGLVHDDQVDAVTGAYQLYWRINGHVPEKVETWQDHHRKVAAAMAGKRVRH